MNKFAQNVSLITLLLAMALVSGCAVPNGSSDTSSNAGNIKLPSTTPAEKTPPTIVTPVVPNDQIALKEGVDLFNNGDFNGTIKKLSAASEIWNGGSLATQQDALKYMAFSYCVTSRPTLCKTQFEKALKLNPAFDLTPGEKGHPLWGPPFERAKKSK